MVCVGSFSAPRRSFIRKANSRLALRLAKTTLPLKENSFWLNS